VKEENRVKGEDQQVKGEIVKGENSVKLEGKRVKNDRGVKGESNEDEFSCYINKIDHSNKAIDFSSLPEDVVRAELLNIGVRVCTLTKKQLAGCIADTWTYRKTGKIPLRFFEYSEDEARYLNTFHTINKNR
jgi:hypothetical protein